MDVATTLFLKGLGWGLGVGTLALSVCTAWGAFVKSCNSI